MALSPMTFFRRAGADISEFANFTVAQGAELAKNGQEILFDFTPFTSTNMSRRVLFFDIEGAGSADPNDDKFQVDDLVFDLYSTLGTSNFEVT